MLLLLGVLLLLNWWAEIEGGGSLQVRTYLASSYSDDKLCGCGRCDSGIQTQRGVKQVCTGGRVGSAATTNPPPPSHRQHRRVATCSGLTRPTTLQGAKQKEPPDLLWLSCSFQAAVEIPWKNIHNVFTRRPAVLRVHLGCVCERSSWFKYHGTTERGRICWIHCEHRLIASLKVIF